MKRALSTFVCLLASATVLVSAEREKKSDTKPDAGGVMIDPSEGEIAPGSELTITFPDAMVNADKIDMSGQPVPFVSLPKIDGDFLWKSQTEGVFTVKGVVAGAKHRLTLVRDLKDARGKPVVAPGWSAEFSTTEFNLTTDFTAREHLEAQPQIALESTYNVRLSEVPDHVYFQDRDSQQRFPVNVILWSQAKLPSESEATTFSVSPRAPLPTGHTYDLIVNGLVEARSHKALPYLKVIPAGTTAPLEIAWVGAFNSGFEERSIRIKFSDEIEPAEATPDKIDIQPAVKDAKMLASLDEVKVTGTFDLNQRYRVTISTALKGARGYGLAAESRWGATFRPAQPCILFPASQVFLRARQELRFSFFQFNTPAVTWKLARIPLEKLPAVTKRVRDFATDARDPVTGQAIVDPRTGFNKQFQTEVLVDAFNLPVIATGTTEATSGDASVKRDIRCAAPKGEALSGAYLLEASAALTDGRIVGNRSIICTSDFILTQKRTPASAIVRVAKMSDAQPVAGVTVRAVTSENIELARAVTAQNGMATFDHDKVFPEKKTGAHLFIADTVNGPALQFADGATYSSGYSETSRQQTKTHAEIITDRNLYRPGQIVKMKGLVRETAGAALTIPSASDVRWRVTESYGERVVGEGTATLSRDGGWEAEWTVPEKSKLGRFEIRCQVGGQNYDGSTAISIEEYRVPLFSAVVDADPGVGDTAHAKVSSAYFHGAPNAGARVHWKANWTVSFEFGSEADGYKKRFNSYSEVGPRVDTTTDLVKTIEGDTQLDQHGFATLSCESPFKNDAAISKSDVFWRADVTSIDGQTITGGATAALFANPVVLGVHSIERPGENGGIVANIDAVDSEAAQVTGAAVHVDLFHVTTKTAKEQISSFVFRYRNVDEFTKVASQESKTPAEVFFPAKETGRYVVAVSATDRKTALVSDETTLTGEMPAELPVENETGFKVERAEKPYTPGEKATLSIQAPFGGVAWVSVETGEILDTLLVPVAGNAGRIELPIKKEYAPNAVVSIYLVKPGGEKELPKERFAYSTIEVRRPDHELKIESQVMKSVKPGETVRGELHVSSESKPVEDVDLAVFAVDDAVLKLGSWQLPEVLAGFYQRNPFGVRSYQSLERYLEEIKVPSLTQKGFTIGGGGEEAVPNVTNLRKEFKTLAFWRGSLKTGRDGKATFDFVAPDNLTTYRIVAVGQTKANQFGGDASATVQVSKPLLINPALPRFLRHGDEVELRASVQQNFADSEEVTVRCVTDASCKLIGETSATRPAARDVPTVFRFKAKVDDPNLAPAKIQFQAVAKSNAQLSDALELTLPVQAPTIVRRESVAGSVTGPQFDTQSKMPNDWKRGRGKVDTIVSSSMWLPKIAGIPLILEYPHGCFDQISTKLLGYSLLANLLAYLPDIAARDAEFRSVLERGMKQFNDSLLEGGMLPYWPGGTVPNPFVTCEAFWAVNESVNAGFQAPEGLRDKLAAALKKIVNGEKPTSPFERCFALFVLTQYETEGDFATAAQDLYLRRNSMEDEGRALLAIALQRLNIMPREKEQLLKEIDAPIKERAFDPKTLGSMTRAEAICALAFDSIAPATYTPQKKQRVRERMLALMDSSASLSTQENLWMLLAFKSMVTAEKLEALGNAQPPGVFSKNHFSEAWLDRKLEERLLIKGLNKSALTFLMKAEYSTDEVETDRVDRGFRVERVVKNVTDAKRTGEASAPFKLGDQILITYRMNTRKKQSYVALEDSLPAGLEVVNPNLAMIGKFYTMPPSSQNDHVLDLSYSEMRDRSTLLYFDDFSPGGGTYSVLARATAAGSFRWPATQVVPMYDSRFSGLSPSSLCVVSGE
ncbi:MAG: alpha-2-macroglobulin family protein [Verrucomicrobiota bacterium]